MDKEVLIKEMMWDYNYPKSKATSIVDFYEAQGKYKDLCDLVIAKKELLSVTH